MKKYLNIENLKIGEEFEPVIIAELGINHNGNLDRAIYLADLAIKSGAKIIKHQTHFPEFEMSNEAKKIVPSHCKESIYSIIQNCSLSKKNEIKLKKYINQKKKIYISTPFSREAAKFLNDINVPAFKIGSGECNNYPLVDYISSFKKPIILSTGMNLINKIKPSVDIIRKKKIPYALLICTNIYPTADKDVCIGTIPFLKSVFPDALIGISDHSKNIFCSLGAVALGARIIEKHFVDTKKAKGPDVSASMDPSDLTNLINGSKSIFNARGVKKKISNLEKKTSLFAFASVVSTKNITKGETFSEKNIFVKRPGNGDFKVTDLRKLFGKTAKKNIIKNYQIKKTDVKK